MRFSAYEPRGRFRTTRARPYQFDITVVGGGFLIVMVGIAIGAFAFPLFTQQFYQVPFSDNYIRPTYPAEALEQGLEGELLVRFLVDEQGDVIAPEIIEADLPGVFDASVLETVNQWTYRDFKHLGRGPESRITMRFRFLLPENQKAELLRTGRYSIFPEQVVYGAFDTPPVLINRIDPIPLMAPAGSVREGVIIIEEIPESFQERWMKECLVILIVDETGTVKFPGIPYRFNRSMDTGSWSSILDSVREWRFQPATRNGDPVSILVCQRVEYFLR